MTPGAFLRESRLLAGLTLDDVALRTDTTPPIAARERAVLIDAIEHDLVSLEPHELAALRKVYGFEPTDMAARCVHPAPATPRPVIRSAA